MNYIKHLSAFYEKVVSDNRLFPSHISLYLALFQYWNFNHFHNPVSISRKEVMQLCKIGSLNTYHKCLHDLHSWGYIAYEPSHNQFVGSSVSLYNFDTTTDTTSVQALRQQRRKNDTTSIQALRHSINNINVLNNKLYRGRKSQTQNQKIENFKEEKNEKEKRKKVAPKKEKEFEPPNLDAVISFFKMESYPEVESRKFFYHFEANGWKIAGKTPMKNWQAAAHNWMLNAPKYEPENKPSAVKLNTNKNYGEPL